MCICKVVKIIYGEMNEPPHKKPRTVSRKKTSRLPDASIVPMVLSDGEKLAWSNKIAQKVNELTGINAQGEISLQLLRVQDNIQTIQLQCYIGSCTETLSIYKECTSGGGKYKMPGLVKHIKRKRNKFNSLLRSNERREKWFRLSRRVHSLTSVLTSVISSQTLGDIHCSFVHHQKLISLCWELRAITSWISN